MTIGEKIKHLRKQQGITQEELATAASTTKQTIHKYETGIISNIPASKIKAMSDKLHTTPAYLMGWEHESTSKENLPHPNITDDFVTFPVIGEIAAGYDCIVLEDWCGDTVDIPASYLKGREKTDFMVLDIKGSSMFPEYQNGDKVLILKQDTLEYSGQVGAVMYDDQYTTLKKVEYKDGEDWLRLVPINPNHEKQVIEGEALEHCRILGIPRLLIRDIKS